MRSYVVDLIIQSRSRTHARLDTRSVILHLPRLGFSINVEKSAFIPQQTAVYLGIQLDTVAMRARLSDERLETILSLASRVYSQPRVSVETARRLLGLMASASAVVLLAYFTHEACRGGLPVSLRSSSQTPEQCCSFRPIFSRTCSTGPVARISRQGSRWEPLQIA